MSEFKLRARPLAKWLELFCADGDMLQVIKTKDATTSLFNKRSNMIYVAANHEDKRIETLEAKVKVMRDYLVELSDYVGTERDIIQWRVFQLNVSGQLKETLAKVAEIEK